MFNKGLNKLSFAVVMLGVVSFGEKCTASVIENEPSTLSCARVNMSGDSTLSLKPKEKGGMDFLWKNKQHTVKIRLVRGEWMQDLELQTKFLMELSNILQKDITIQNLEQFLNKANQEYIRTYRKTELEEESPSSSESESDLEDLVNASFGALLTSSSTAQFHYDSKQITASFKKPE